MKKTTLLAMCLAMSASIATAQTNWKGICRTW